DPDRRAAGARREAEGAERGRQGEAGGARGASRARAGAALVAPCVAPRRADGRADARGVRLPVQERADRRAARLGPLLRRRVRAADLLDRPDRVPLVPEAPRPGTAEALSDRTGRPSEDRKTTRLNSSHAN